MKIIYISDSAIPSSSPNSVHVMKMAQAFSELGHDVTLVAKNTTACIRNVTNIFEFYAVKEIFNLNIAPRLAFRGSGAYYNLSLAWRVLWMKADLYYTRSISAAFFLLLFGRRIAFEVHEPYDGKGVRLRGMFKYIVDHKGLIRLVVISQALKDYYTSHFDIIESQIVVAHDGADPFPPIPAASGGDSFKVGYVGSLYPGKGMEILLPLCRATPTVQYQIVGGNENQIRDWEKKAGAQGITNITFHGFKSQQEIPRYLVSFDAVIAPYSLRVIVSEKRGANNLATWMSPLKIFEYMAAQKPIITSDLPVIREILQHRETALLCDPEKLEEWAIAVRELAGDAALRVKLAENSNLLFLREFTWSKRARHVLDKMHVLL